jgi:hypothetical protein
MQENECTMTFVSLKRLDLALGALAMNLVDLNTQGPEIPEIYAKVLQLFGKLDLHEQLCCSIPGHGCVIVQLWI